MGSSLTTYLSLSSVDRQYHPTAPRSLRTRNYRLDRMVPSRRASAGLTACADAMAESRGLLHPARSRRSPSPSQEPPRLSGSLREEGTGRPHHQPPGRSVVGRHRDVAIGCPQDHPESDLGGCFVDRDEGSDLGRAGLVVSDRGDVPTRKVVRLEHILGELRRFPMGLRPEQYHWCERCDQAPSSVQPCVEKLGGSENHLVVLESGIRGSDRRRHKLLLVLPVDTAPLERRPRVAPRRRWLPR